VGDDSPIINNFDDDLIICKNVFNPLLSDNDECQLYLKTLKRGIKHLQIYHSHLLIIRDSSLLVCSAQTFKERINILMKREEDLIFLSRWQDRCDKQKILSSDKFGKIKTTLEPNSTQALLFSKKGLSLVYLSLKKILSSQKHIKLNKIINKLIHDKKVTAICHDPPLFVYDSDLAAHYNFYSKNATCLTFDVHENQEENNFLLMILLILLVVIIIGLIIIRS
jgi:hypothetical protein